MSLSQGLSDIFSEVFNFKGELTDDLEPSSVPGWDSVAHIAMVEAIESHFNIRLTTDEMVEITSVKKIKDVIKQYINEN